MSVPCRDLNKLHPEVKRIAEAFLVECKKQGLDIGISETFRTVERQDNLYAQGRSMPGQIVTNAIGRLMSSYHQWGLAFDIYNNKPGDLYNVTILNDAGRIGKKLGLEWGGDWHRFIDRPHFQYTFGLSIADLKAGRKPTIVKGVEDVASAKDVKPVRMQVNGVIKSLDAITVDNFHYVKVRDIADHYIKVDYDTMKKLPIIECRA